MRLDVLESVAEWDPLPAHANLFKRKLTKKELRVLVTRGLVERPRNDHYFHGHVSGKVGIRPAHDVWLGIHRAMDSQREPIDVRGSVAANAPLRVGVWSGLRAKVAQLARIRDGGQYPDGAPPIADAFQAEIDAEATDGQGLKSVFQQTTADDVETLRVLGYLEEIDPLKHGHVPTAYAKQDALLYQLRGLISEDKRVFEPERDVMEVREVLRRAAG
ncbi:hypothetical protein [Nocardioides sp. B-3]|uniref:hypothetical protein n=1 Tax=Nocardioides sp. B-3 TaxID=2895565 RepID=UPI002153987B|nr:hypothetical protein [Nocardioides sp. B-3]UUZ58651.1 hypothetical protein LP418_21390 [Nocardioides sp. B-3]